MEILTIIKNNICMYLAKRKLFWMEILTIIKNNICMYLANGNHCRCNYTYELYTHTKYAEIIWTGNILQICEFTIEICTLHILKFNIAEGIARFA